MIYPNLFRSSYYQECPVCDGQWPWWWDLHSK